MPLSILSGGLTILPAFRHLKVVISFPIRLLKLIKKFGSIFSHDRQKRKQPEVVGPYLNNERHVNISQKLLYFVHSNMFSVIILSHKFRYAFKTIFSVYMLFQRKIFIQKKEQLWYDTVPAGV